MIKEVDSGTPLLHDKDNELNEFKRSSNTFESTFNLSNTIIGGGIIGLAYALRIAGLPMGLILLAMCGVVTDYAIILLLKSGELADTYTYQGVVEQAFGKTGLIAISISQFLFPYTGVMAYNVAISDDILIVLERTIGSDTIFANRQFINGMVVLCIILPLSIPRNIALLDKFSALSIVCVLFYSLVIIIRAGTLAPLTVPSPNAWDFARGGVAQAFGVMAYAFACLHNVFPLYRALENTSVKRYSKVVHSSVIFSSIFYIAVALAGYITFTDMSQGNLLNNYCPNDDLANVARFVFAFTLVLTYPLQVFAAREVIETGFFRNRPKSWIRHIMITFFIIATATAVSMTTDSLGLVVELVGCFSASPLVFIFPPICYMKLKNEGFMRCKYILLWFMVIFGIALMILGTTMAILAQANNSEFTDAQRYWCPGNSRGSNSSNITTMMPLYTSTVSLVSIA